jgi:hypothetical protein
MFVLIVSFLICICFVAFVSSNDLCRLQNDQVFLSNDLKTIMSFQIEFFEFYFTFWSFYFVLNSCTRKWHSAVIESIKKETWWWWSKRFMMINENDDQSFFHKAKKCFRSSSSRSHCSFSSNFFVLIMIIISCLSRWSYCAICLWELFGMRNFMRSWECSVCYYQSFFISVSLERSTSSLFAWALLRCLNCSSLSVARRYLNTLAINLRMSKSVNKFVSRLFVHIFFRRSSNFEHFNNV